MNTLANVFEDPDFNKSPDTVIRPGGFILTRRMIEACALPENSRIIDVGCGTGMTVELLRSEFLLDAIGMDISEALIRIGKIRSPGIQLIHGSGEDLPFGDGSAQAVISECSLSVMENTDRVLSEIHRVLMPGGKLAVSDVFIRGPEGAELLRKQVQGGCFFNALTKDEMLGKLSENGFALSQWEDRTDLWRSYVAEMIMGNRSQEKIWSAVSEAPDASGCMKDILLKVRPGYFWMAAEKI